MINPRAAGRAVLPGGRHGTPESARPGFWRPVLPAPQPLDAALPRTWNGPFNGVGVGEGVGGRGGEVTVMDPIH